MTKTIMFTRLRNCGLVAVATVFLSSCVMVPGQFVSQLILEDDGEFTFSYDGEISFVGIEQLSELDKPALGELPEPTCIDEETFADRECTPEEISEQRAVHEAQVQRQADRGKEEAAMFASLLGGVDLSDAADARLFAQRVRRQTGWSKVEYIGDGKFDVEFNISGELDFDFTFPTFEGVSAPSPFVTLSVRNDGTVRMNAPSFARPSNANPVFLALIGFGDSSQSRGDMANPFDELVKINGTFQLVTSGEVLANNTDTGPERRWGRSVLNWAVDNRLESAPTALIRLD